MRKIKFKAWLKKEYFSVLNPENKVYDVENLDFDTQQAYLSECGWYDFKDIELMQYTGLKDKNGVEIYEGDIIQFQPEPEEKPYHNKYVVDFFQEDCSFSLFQKGKAKLGLFEYERNEIIVVGNIYENPELLTA